MNRILYLLYARMCRSYLNAINIATAPSDFRREQSTRVAAGLR
jgi:hypothetical protein